MSKTVPFLAVCLSALVLCPAILDGFSDTVFWTELNAAYAALAAGKQPELAPLAAQYSDFALWQAEKLYQCPVVSTAFAKMAELYMAAGVGCAPPPDYPGVPVSRHHAERQCNMGGGHEYEEAEEEEDKCRRSVAPIETVW
eukprot:SAG22_NODE_4336_length_1300_cov_1.418818_2_plen_141_part_00